MNTYYTACTPTVNLWIEHQTENYWVQYSGCQTIFKAGVIITDSFSPGFDLPQILQQMANTILRNTTDGAIGTFRGQTAQVVKSETNERMLKTQNGVYRDSSTVKVQSVMLNATSQLYSMGRPAVPLLSFEH